MNNFVIQLNRELPEPVAYLGVGVNKDGERFGVIAKHVGDDADISVFGAPILYLRRALDQKYSDENLQWAEEKNMYERAVQEVESRSFPFFLIEPSKISVIYTKEIIAAASSPGAPYVAVCDVEGANPHYIPSFCAYERGSGLCNVYRLGKYSLS